MSLVLTKSQAESVSGAMRAAHSIGAILNIRVPRGGASHVEVRARPHGCIYVLQECLTDGDQFERHEDQAAFASAYSLHQQLIAPEK